MTNGRIGNTLKAMILAATVLAGAANARTAPQAPPAPATTKSVAMRPNILLILSDDNSVPHDGCHKTADSRAYQLTPNLEAFAAQGICFERAYTTASQCAPSRASIFAGRNPVDLGVTRFAQPVRRDVPFFSDLLRSSGYWVGLEGRNHHLAGREDDPPHVKAALAQAGLSRIGDRFDYVNTFGTKGLAPTEVAARVGATLDKVPAGKPFFLYFGFNQTHRKFVADHSDIDPSRLHLPPDWPDLPAVREDYAAYLADLRSMDRQFGSLMAMLKARGLAENTIVVFMGDNGEAMYRGKGTLYERGNHVPLIVRWPGGAKAGSRDHSLVSGIDLAKTFLEAAGQAPDARMTGTSLVSRLKGQGGSGPQYVFTERGWHPGGLNVSEGLDYARAITGQRYKLIYNAQPAQPYSPVDQGGRFIVRDPKQAAGRDEDPEPARPRTDEERALGAWKAVVQAHAARTLPARIDRLYFARPRPVFELYDLQADPYEFDNLAGKPEYGTIEVGLRKELDKWMALSGDYLPLATDAYRETPSPSPP
jgi:N-sulfoglucosamine sulfohydrolase